MIIGKDGSQYGIGRGEPLSMEWFEDREDFVARLTSSMLLTEYAGQLAEKLASCIDINHAIDDLLMNTPADDHPAAIVAVAKIRAIIEGPNRAKEVPERPVAIDLRHIL